MAPVKFYFMRESPPCRAVEMTADLLGVELEKIPVNLFAGEHLKEDYVKLNPLHQVPFVVDGEHKMGESRAIMMYLVNKYKPGSSLYPSDPSKRAKVDQALFYEIGTLAQAQYKMFRSLMAGKDAEPEDVKAVKDCYQHVDKTLVEGKAKFLTGDELTIADVSLAATLSYADAIEFDLSEFKNLTAYLASVKSSITNYAEINDQAVANLRQFVQSKKAGN